MNTRVEDIRKENLLTKNWKFAKQNISDFKDGILVTGANSFIGCHVVRILGEKYSGPVHLLLRAPSHGDAVNKMNQSFVQWELGEFQVSNFIIHTGDVCQPQMNLTDKEFHNLKQETGQVIHLAMTPMYHLPYHHFQRIWIPELERMISFCGDARYPKFLHYASSYNANFFQSDEDFHALNSNAWQSGYAGFKWVANQALQHAMDQNLNASVYDIPLVLGSEKNGICPGHYSIWMILDIFLKTGYFFPFSFNIIPVDILAGVIVFNVLKVKYDQPAGFCRPMLEEPVTDKLFSKTAANLLGIREAALPVVREACLNKLRFNFMMPENFYSLMDKVTRLKAEFPAGFQVGLLPVTPLVFMSNLNRIMSSKPELIKV